MRLLFAWMFTNRIVYKTQGHKTGYNSILHSLPYAWSKCSSYSFTNFMNSSPVMDSFSSR